MILKAFFIAKKAHKGQVDKSGERYINHPVAVATSLFTEKEKAVALLHDVIEDTKITEEDLVNLGIPIDVVEAVKCLSKEANIDYFDYLQRVKVNALARAVKIADLTHNMDLSRLKHITNKDLIRYEKYKKAMSFMLS